MKNKLRTVFYWAITLMVLLLPLFTTAYTYGSSRRSSDSSDSSWIFIPIIIFVAGFLALVIIQRIKTSKEAGAQSQTQLKISSVVQEQLLPDEKVIRQINTGRAEFIATDKRLLRFTSKGCEPIEYGGISAVSYRTSLGKKLLVSIIVGICVLIALWITIYIWISAFDSSVSNVSITDATVLTVFFVVFGFVGYLGTSHDYGYYQIESEVYEGSAKKSWRLTRPPWFWGNAHVDKFVETIKEYISA